jgi:tripartite-type tricarboxylate transporter receptor subunit TctC
LKRPRRKFLRLAAGTVALPIISRVASAQAYPARPITMIVPLAAGSSLDVVARLVGERMGTVLGQPIIIENVPGADGSIGVGRVARARPDGYTIEFGFQGANVLNGAFYSLSYDLLGDLSPISPVAVVPWVLYAKASLPAKDLKELIVWAKGQSQQGVSGRHHGRLPHGDGTISERKPDPVHPCPVSRLSPGNAGLGRGPDRFFL